MENNQLTYSQRQLRNKIEDLRDQILTIKSQIDDCQKSCEHVWVNYLNPDVEVKYCVICEFETWK